MEYTEEKEPPDVITSDTNNATKIEPKEAPPGKRRKFRRFRAYNTGTWNGPKRENKEVTRRQDNLHRYDSISSSLNLSGYQKSRGRKILDDLNIRKIGIGVDAVIFGICAVVANDDVEDGTRYWPQPSSQDNGSSPFKDVADSLGYCWQEQMSIIKKIQSRVDT